MIINQSQINNYLNVKKDAMEILNSIKPPALKFHEISKDVNNPVNNDPALIKPIKLNELIFLLLIAKIMLEPTSMILILKI